MAVILPSRIGGVYRARWSVFENRNARDTYYNIIFYYDIQGWRTQWCLSEGMFSKAGLFFIFQQFFTLNCAYAGIYKIYTLYIIRVYYYSVVHFLKRARLPLPLCTHCYACMYKSLRGLTDDFYLFAVFSSSFIFHLCLCAIRAHIRRTSGST